MVLGERLGWEVFVGMGMIFTGLIAIDGRWIKRLKWKNQSTPSQTRHSKQRGYRSGG